MNKHHMQIYINDAPHTVDAQTTFAQARASFLPEATAAILNTVPNPSPETVLREQDRLYLYKHKGEFADGDLRELILARQPHAATEKLRTACVGIAGAGGLGSVVAENLARAGIGRLIIADCDVVEPSNLNRQRFQLRQVGMAKTAALAANLRESCPFVTIDAVQERISADNCVRVFDACAIVCECFDAAESKASLVTDLRRQLPDCIIIAASGLAGCGSARSITISRVSANLYIVGDMNSDANSGIGLFAPRVGIVASLQSHVATQIILEEPI
jgi:sulfur carrier protein ThiS adenylyltransferase